MDILTREDIESSWKENNMEANNMTEQNKTWLQTEAEELGKNSKFTGEALPALKFEEGKITTFEVDFSNPFNKYETEDMKGKSVIKKIIPVTHNGVKKILWLNVKNPLYNDLVKAGAAGKKVFQVIQNGKLDKTTYQLLKE